MAAVRIVHKLPSRVRLQSVQLVRQQAACERIADALVEEPGVERVSLRPTTGSVIVEGAGLDPARLLARLAALMDAEHDDQGRPLTAPRPVPTGPDRLAKALATAMQTLNTQVYEALHGEADLATLAPVILTGVSAAEVAAAGKLPAPSWSSLLWYSLQMFTTFKKKAIREQAR